MQYLMLLNDGETYTNLTGCAVIGVPDDIDDGTIEELLDAEPHPDLVVVCTFDVRDGVPVLDDYDLVGVHDDAHKEAT